MLTIKICGMNYVQTWINKKEVFKALRFIKNELKLRIKILRRKKNTFEIKINNGEDILYFVSDLNNTFDEIFEFYETNNSIVLVKRLKPLLFKGRSEFLTNLKDKKETLTHPSVRIGNETVNFTKITNEDNACTDVIQSLLNEGWRIICCIPQPHQSRPDYILGKE